MSEILNGPSISKHNNPKKLIFMLHGYGDNAANFMHLANPIDQEEWQAQYVALNAPKFIEGNFMGYQWFDLYPNGIYIAEAGPKEFKQIKQETDAAVIKIVNTIQYYCDELKLTFEDCILMGFSQGGMITFEVGNFLKKKLAGLLIISGRIMNDQKITNSIVKKTPIFISHGEMDNVIPISAFYQSQEYLKKNNCNFEAHILNQDGHNISPDTITLLQKFIKKIL